MNKTSAVPPGVALPTEASALRRKRRGRNLAILAVLVGLSILFYAVTIVKMARF